MTQKEDSSKQSGTKRNKIEALIRKLHSKNFRKKNQVIERLGKYKSTRAINTLYEIVESSKWTDKQRINAINALGKHNRKTNRFKQTLKKVVDEPSENRELRRAALTHLSKLRDPQLIGMFKRALNDDYRFIRFWAVRALIKMSNKKAETALIQALGDKDEEIRKNVYMHLERSGPEIIPYLKVAAKSPDANKQLRYGIMGLLGRLGHEDAIPILIDALDAGNDRVVRIAIRGLGKVTSAKSIKPLLDLYAKENMYERFVQSSLYKIAQADILAATIMFVSYILDEESDDNAIELIIQTLKNLRPESTIAIGELKTDPKLAEPVREKMDGLMERLENED